MNGPEKKIQDKIVTRLQEAGITVLYLKLLEGRGWPDLTCMYKGKQCFIEVKQPGGVVSPQQWQISEMLHDCGFTTYFADGVYICDIVIAELGAG